MLSSIDGPPKCRAAFLNSNRDASDKRNTAAAASGASIWPDRAHAVAAHS